MFTRCFQTALLTVALAAPAATQNLILQARGGSYPGAMQLSMGTGPVGQACAIVLDPGAGPTPLFLLDPRDPRLLNVGISPLTAVFPGLLLPPNAQFATPVFPVPNDPNLDGVPLYLQGFDFPGTQYAVGRLSNPAVVRFAPSGSFRDRGANLITSRTFPSMLPMADGRWLAAAGGQGNILAQLPLRSSEVYDVLTDSWSAGPSLFAERGMHTATELRDGRWLLTGGLDLNQAPQQSCEIWDPVAMTFSPAAAMGFKRASHQAVRLPDGRVWVTGGISLPPSGGNLLSVLNSGLVETELYDPVTDTWARGPDMLYPRIQHSILTLPSGNLLVVGGIGWARILFIKVPALFDQCDVFDPAAGTISAGPRMLTARGGFSVADLGGARFLIAGGGDTVISLSPGAPTNKTEIFDANTNTWTSAAPMAVARTFHQVFSIDGTRYLHVGGADGSLLGLNALGSTEIYDAAAGTWSMGPNLTVPRAGPGTFETPMGQVQFVGGQGFQGGNPSTELYYR